MELDQKAGKKILVITYWDFNDPLIKTYTLPYLDIIAAQNENHEIKLVTLDNVKKEKPNQISEQITNISFRYRRFGLRALLNNIWLLVSLTFLIIHEKVDVIHTWCTPAGGIGFILSKITGRPLVLDSCEPHAEPMIESGTWGVNSIAFQLLFWLEKNQIKHSEEIIACVPSMKDYIEKKYHFSPKNFLWKPACVDLAHFSSQKVKDPELLRELNLEGKVVAVYAGKFGGSYLEQEVFDFFKAARDHWQDQFHALVLNGQPDELIDSYCEDAGLGKSCITKMYVPFSEIPRYIGLGDFGLVPFKPVPSKRYGSPIKTGEYLAMGLPIVITDGISDDSALVETKRCGFVLKSLERREYENACIEIAGLLEKKGIRNDIRSICVEEKSFDNAKRVYSKLYG